MAENQDKKESKSKVTYKLGEEQLDLEQYLYNLGINVKGYMDSMNWNEGQKEEFMNSYNKLKEKDRKKYQTFSANRKVATYLDKVGRKLAEYQAN